MVETDSFQVGSGLVLFSCGLWAIVRVFAREARNVASQCGECPRIWVGASLVGYAGRLGVSAG